jgi:phosphosulfolactate synthase
MGQNFIERAFEKIKIQNRPAKPRESGITMLCDQGYGIHEQKDILELAHPFIDIAKIATGIAGTISEKMVRKKIETYEEYNIDTFLGGMFLEYAIFYQGIDIANHYFEEHQRLGLNLVEISDNNLDIAPEDKFNLIRTAKEKFGLRVLGEVGTKSDTTSIQELVQDIKGCLAAGSWKVFIEAAELTSKTDGTILTDVIEDIQKAIDINDVIIELPGPWIKNYHHFHAYEMQRFLVETFGPEVNVANVKADMIIQLEMFRNGLERKLEHR